MLSNITPSKFALAIISNDLKTLIQNGADFYPSLKGQKSITTLLADPQFVSDVVIPKIESKGIGNIEQFISQNKKTITPLDVEKATSGVTREGINAMTNEIRGELTPGRDDKGIEQ